MGGAETYIERAASRLCAGGHDIALLSGIALPDEREPLQMPPGASIWCTSILASEQTINELCSWHPDIVDHTIAGLREYDAHRGL